MLWQPMASWCCPHQFSRQPILASGSARQLRLLHLNCQLSPDLISITSPSNFRLSLASVWGFLPCRTPFLIPRETYQLTCPFFPPFPNTHTLQEQERALTGCRATARGHPPGGGEDGGDHLVGEKRDIPLDLQQVKHQGQDHAERKEHEAPLHQVVVPAAGPRAASRSSRSLAPGHRLWGSGPLRTVGCRNHASRDAVRLRSAGAWVAPDVVVQPGHRRPGAPWEAHATTPRCSAPGRPRSGRGPARVSLIRRAVAGATWPDPAYPPPARPAAGRVFQGPRPARAPVRSGSGEAVGANGRRAAHMTCAHATRGVGLVPGTRAWGECALHG